MDNKAIIELLTSRSWIQPHSEGGCWLWQGYRLPAGYGLHTVYNDPTAENGKRTWLVHRLSMWAHGYDIEGLTVDHQCANKNCFNPLHLELITLEENTRRAVTHRWGIYRRLHALSVAEEMKVTK